MSPTRIPRSPLARFGLAAGGAVLAASTWASGLQGDGLLFDERLWREEVAASNDAGIDEGWYALAVTPDARGWLAERGYDPVFGARPLRRLIQSEIQDRLAMAILGGGVHDGDVVRVDVAADGSGLSLISEGPAPVPETDDEEEVIEAELLDD